MPTDFLVKIDPKDGLPKNEKSLSLLSWSVRSDTEQPDAAVVCSVLKFPII